MASLSRVSWGRWPRVTTRIQKTKNMFFYNLNILKSTTFCVDLSCESHQIDVSKIAELIATISASQLVRLGAFFEKVQI